MDTLEPSDVLSKRYIKLEDSKSNNKPILSEKQKDIIVEYKDLLESDSQLILL